MICVLPAYTISWTDPNERQYDIAISFTAPADHPRLTLPAWRPGRYLIQNYAANISRCTAAGLGGDQVKIEKDGKSSWRVFAQAGAPITVTYRYYAGVLDGGSSFLDENEAYFNGSNLFMMVEGLRDAESRLSIAAPAEWRIETQLPREDANTFIARDYDHLVDSPVLAAPRLTRHSFNESGAVIHLIFIGSEQIDTDQFIDPVRAITNHSSGKMGFALAQACAEAGASVALVAGPTSQCTPAGVTRIDVKSAAEMAAAVDREVAAAQVFIAVAAVADYTPAKVQTSKMKKDGKPVSLALEPTVDILAKVAARPKPPFCVGFAAETNDVLENAEAKRRSKKVPLLVANRAQDALGKNENEVTLLDDAGAHALPRMEKLALARRLVAEIAHRLG
jgi:hypothetical protein